MTFHSCFFQRESQCSHFILGMVICLVEGDRVWRYGIYSAEETTPYLLALVSCWVRRVLSSIIFVTWRADWHYLSWTLLSKQFMNEYHVSIINVTIFSKQVQINFHLLFHATSSTVRLDQTHVLQNLCHVCKYSSYHREPYFKGYGMTKSSTLLMCILIFILCQRVKWK